MLRVIGTKRYEKDLDLILRRGLPRQELEDVVKSLAEEKPLDPKYKDHKLQGEFSKSRECHIRPNWLLLYRKDKRALTLHLIRTGSHSDIFG